MMKKILASFLRCTAIALLTGCTTFPAYRVHPHIECNCSDTVNGEPHYMAASETFDNTTAAAAEKLMEEKHPAECKNTLGQPHKTMICHPQNSTELIVNR